MALACSSASSIVSTGPPDHGATGTLVASARYLASTLSPSRRIASGGGPMNVTPSSAHSSANTGSSATKPQPTQAASALDSISALRSTAWSRYGLLSSPFSRIRTPSSASRTNSAPRSDSVCRAMTLIP